MSVTTLPFQPEHPLLQPEVTTLCTGERWFPITLPAFPEGREFSDAWLVLPANFPNFGAAFIRLPMDCALRIPHVEASGTLCLPGDPGNGIGATPDERIDYLLTSFEHDFLLPWMAGDLDADFDKEALNYWSIHCANARSLLRLSPIRQVYVVGARPAKARCRAAIHLFPQRTIVVGDNSAMTERVLKSLSQPFAQQRRVLVAEIPISYPLTPTTWPQSEAEVLRLVNARLPHRDHLAFATTSSRGRHPVQRVVLLRGPHYNFAFLLPGGPAIIIRENFLTRSFRTSVPTPLMVERFDPSWTSGRDQEPAVPQRQASHVLVLGAGALGSAVIDQLAKAGIGRITIIDHDVLSTANIGRHLLGADRVGFCKSEAVAASVGLANPSVEIEIAKTTAEQWLASNEDQDITLIVDLTGEPDVRFCVDLFRRVNPCPLVIGWMEPYVAAAHACLLPSGTPWMTGVHDPMEKLLAVTWPTDIALREPACSSEFHSYTPAAAAYATGIVTETVLSLLDNDEQAARVRSWVRGQQFLDRHHPNLALRPWAHDATAFDGVILDRPFP